jgi:hypothetical protein
MVRLIINELRAGADNRDTDVYALTRQYTQRTIAIVEEGIASGEFRKDIPVRLMRDMIYGGVEHHTWSFLRGDAGFSPDDTANAITDLVYRALATDKSSHDFSMGQAVERLNEVAHRMESSLNPAGRKPGRKQHV